MAPDIASQRVEFACVTPLYHFSADSEELGIANGIKIKPFRAFPCDEVLSRQLAIYEPTCLIWQRPSVSVKTAEEIAAMAMQESLEPFSEACSLLMAPTREILQTLQLFKPGRLRAGETFLAFRKFHDDAQKWNTAFSHRCSFRVVDYGILQSQTTSYSLRSDELPLLRRFFERVTLVLGSLSSFPELEFALLMYGGEDGPRMDVVNALTALEALLLGGKEGELSYRLSIRMANLMGHDADQRTRIFEQVKSFYDLRSKIVHGSRLKSKHLTQMEEIEALRELLRRVVLSVMSLLLQNVSGADLDRVLDEITLDEAKRESVQSAASKLLHIA